MLALGEGTAVQAGVGFSVWAFRRLWNPRSREMNASGYALQSVCPILPTFHPEISFRPVAAPAHCLHEKFSRWEFSKRLTWVLVLKNHVKNCDFPSTIIFRVDVKTLQLPYKDNMHFEISWTWELEIRFFFWFLLEIAVTISAPSLFLIGIFVMVARPFDRWRSGHPQWNMRCTTYWIKVCYVIPSMR